MTKPANISEVRKRAWVTRRAKNSSRVVVRPACKVEGCEKPVKALGYCTGHRKRLKLYGDPLGGGTGKGVLLRYMLDVVVPFAGSECLVWPFSRAGTGYGHLYYEGRQQGAHRVACALVHGPAPTLKHEAAHLCGKGHEGCVNPNHLAWKTSAENKADKIVHGTIVRGSDIKRAILTEAKVLEIRALKGTVPGKELAERFGVGASTITAVQKRNTWAWL